MKTKLMKKQKKYRTIDIVGMLTKTDFHISGEKLGMPVLREFNNMGYNSVILLDDRYNWIIKKDKSGQEYLVCREEIK